MTDPLDAGQDPYGHLPKAADAPPVYRRDGDVLVPGPPAVSGWSSALQNGSAVAGLFAHEIERADDGPGALARLSVDLYRPVRHEPLSVVVRQVRDGHRLRLYEAELSVDGLPVARATGLYFNAKKATSHTAPAAPMAPAGDCPAGPLVPWRRKDPNAPPPFEAYCECRWSTPFEDDRPGVWIAPPARIVADETSSPTARLVAATDLMAALAAVHLATREEGFTPYVNADLHVFLHRPPADGFFGLRLESRASDDGVELAEVNLFDGAGRVGIATQTRLAQPRR